MLCYAKGMNLRGAGVCTTNNGCIGCVVAGLACMVNCSSLRLWWETGPLPSVKMSDYFENTTVHPPRTCRRAKSANRAKGCFGVCSLCTTTTLFVRHDYCCNKFPLPARPFSPLLFGTVPGS